MIETIRQSLKAGVVTTNYPKTHRDTEDTEKEKEKFPLFLFESVPEVAEHESRAARRKMIAQRFSAG